MLSPFFLTPNLESGTDEAGRGCLAGPVTAAAVILPVHFQNEWLNDSKQLSEKAREKLRQEKYREYLKDKQTKIETLKKRQTQILLENNLVLKECQNIILMKKRNFKKEDFASFHPGGSLGKKLFVKVDDLLRKENLPVVSRETKLKDAILVMSEGRLGSVIIEDENKKVIALLSDGDLRRALMNDDFSMDCKVEDIATKNPKRLKNKELLASDALQVIEDYKIQLLIVTDENDKLVGVLHIHDLIEAGIK